MAREAIVTSSRRRRAASATPPCGRAGCARSSARRPSCSGSSIVLNACRKLKEPLSHILFDGPPGLGKTTFATVLPNELGTSIQMTSGPALSKPADLLPFLTNARGRLDPVHRRDPPHAARGRGVHLSGDGGFPHRHRARRRHQRPDDLDAAEAVHADRRHDAQRHAVRPDARPLQDARAPGVLHASRSWPRSCASTPRKLQTPRSPTTRPWNWPAAAAARRASPTPGCGGRATTPPARPTAASRSTWPAPPWTWPRSTAKGWTSRIAAIWKR